jgi:malate/lactate dehydrogenase
MEVSMGHIPDINRYKKRIKKEVKKDYQKMHDLLLGKHTELQKIHALEKKARALAEDKLEYVEKKYDAVISRVEGIVQKAKELKNIIPS